MDALDHIAAPGRDLLGRVDATLLELGVPDQPRLWTLLADLGALPGDAFDFVAALRPEPFQDVAGALRARAAAYGQECSALTAAVDAVTWQGAGRDAFVARWHGLAAHLGRGEVPARGEPDSMAGRLGLLAAYADDVADWVIDTRRALAGSLATTLGSAEALRVRAGGRAPGGTEGVPLRDLATAAAAIGLSVLSMVDSSMRAGQDLYAAWAPRLGPLTYRPADDPGAFAPTIVSV